MEQLIVATEQTRSAQLGRGDRNRDLSAASASHRAALAHLGERAEAVLRQAGLGALVTLLLFGKDLNVYGFVGLIMLVGCVAAARHPAAVRGRSLAERKTTPGGRCAATQTCTGASSKPLTDNNLAIENK